MSESDQAAPRRIVQIARSDYESWQGGLEARVEAFVAAIEAHRFTVDEPAPAEAQIVEMIARNGGMTNLVIVDDIAAPMPLDVPAAVTNFQARAELLARPGVAGGATLFDDVEAALEGARAEAAAAGDAAALAAARIALQAWEYANTITRHGGLVAAMAQRLGLTDADLDDLFREAARRGD